MFRFIYNMQICHNQATVQRTRQLRAHNGVFRNVGFNAHSMYNNHSYIAIVEDFFFGHVVKTSMPPLLMGDEQKEIALSELKIHRTQNSYHQSTANITFAFQDSDDEEEDALTESSDEEEEEEEGDDVGNGTESGNTPCQSLLDVDMALNFTGRRKKLPAPAPDISGLGGEIWTQQQQQ